MNRTKYLAGYFGIVLGSALFGSPAYGQPSVSVGVRVPLPTVEIRVESDFYEPLTPHGEWVVVGAYGRCWRPARVEVGWRPYCNGNWERTDAGWYWVSEEPWAWATYHYGRWDFTDQYGWYWVPQTQWAPAWVSWHEGGGYVGWAPLLPSVRVSAGGFVGFSASAIPPRAFVFVKQGQFLDPIRPTSVVVNNNTVINQTVNITKTRVVNHNVINEGPATAIIEKASGRKVPAVPVRELRQQTEAGVAGKQRTPKAPREKMVEPPVRGEVEPPAKTKVAAPAPPQVQKPAKPTDESAAPAQRNEAVDREKKEKPAAEKPPARENNGTNPADKGQDKDNEKKPKN